MDGQGPEVTFLFQFGLIRDAVTVPVSSLNLKTIKDLACSFINSKVSTAVWTLISNINKQLVHLDT
jgi:protein kinase D